MAKMPGAAVGNALELSNPETKIVTKFIRDLIVEHGLKTLDLQ